VIFIATVHPELWACRTVEGCWCGSTNWPRTA